MGRVVGGEVWARPVRWTNRGREKFLWSAGSLGSFWISSLTLHTAHYQTNEMLRKTEPTPRISSRTLEGFAAPICRYVIPFTHGRSLPNPPILSVTTGCCLMPLCCCLLSVFFPPSLTLQDVITPTDVSLQSSYDKSTQKLHISRGRIQN